MKWFILLWITAILTGLVGGFLSYPFVSTQIRSYTAQETQTNQLIIRRFAPSDYDQWSEEQKINFGNCIAKASEKSEVVGPLAVSDCALQSVN